MCVIINFPKGTGDGGHMYSEYNSTARFSFFSNKYFFQSPES